MPHHHPHAFQNFNARQREGLVGYSRRNFLKASLAGIAGLSVPRLLESQAHASAAGQSPRRNKSVILLWMAGGPSHIDMWDMKPDRPPENRGPFSPIATRVPGVRICEYMPRQAAMLDKFTIIRSMDATHSNHEPNMVMQTANLDAAPRVSRTGHLYPAIGSIVAKHHGPNHPSMPAYAAFMRSRSHLAFAGYLGRQYDPFMAQQAARLPIYDLVGNDTGAASNPTLFQMPTGIDLARVQERRALVRSFDSLRSELDVSGSMAAMDRYGQQAVEMIAGRRAQAAFDITREPANLRERYGPHLWCQQALLARRLVEAGVAFVTIDLSYHTASGTWDTHGDNIPPYGGIWNGLRPLLPLFDHLTSTLVGDLDQRGMLDDVLVIAMGEFGRTPQTGTQGSTDGRNHWPVVMSLLLAGGGFRHGQVIGATEADGGSIKERRVTPGDLAATIYHHMGVPLDTHYLDPTGRPRPIIQSGGVIRELV
ncbi:MAG: DUF1501 domain-containing protein [Planctomycetes bacterium]|nr:DUF1501 domain-containing protein [Planctomycetota bacterium]